MALKNLKKNEQILDLELRNKVYKLVFRFAGSHLRELERRSKIPYSTLKYHLHFLAKHDLIIEKSSHSQIRYYPKTVSSEDIEILGLLRQKNVRRILLFLIVSKDCTLQNLEEFTGLSSSTVSWYVNGLMKKNIVRKLISGKNTRYKLIYDKDKLTKVLVAYRESFLDNLVDKTLDMWEIR